MIRILACCIVLLSGLTLHAGNPATLPSKPASHTLQQIEGWTVHVDDRLLAGPDSAVGQRAIALLSNRLFQITQVVPADKLAMLRKVPIWLDRSHGRLRIAQYHPSAGWLKENGFDVAMAKGVHIPDAAEFVRPVLQHEQPWMVLHELSHAFHDQTLGFDNEEIKSAWQRFVDSGKYKSVLHMNGRMRPHYALTNPQEFFAEMSETYFGMNDFYPFNAVELKRDEPEIFAMMQRLWGPLP